MILEILWAIVSLQPHIITENIFQNIPLFFALTAIFYYRFGAKGIRMQVWSWLLFFAFFDMLGFAGITFVGKTHPIESFVFNGAILGIILQKVRPGKMNAGILTAAFFATSVLFG